MADLQGTQLKNGFQNLVTIGATSESNPTDGALTNGKNTAITRITLANGSASNPAYSFTADTDTGMFSSGTGLLDLVTAGSTALTINGNQLTVGLGSASAPSYSFIGDVNTGLFASGADAIGLVTGGSSRLAIDSSGNVEIGANVGIGGTATKKLDIHHADTDGLRFTTADGAETFIDFGDASDNDIGGIIYDHNDNHMRLRTNNAERIRMFSDGDISFMSVSQNRDFYWEAGNSRLGIGTTSPSQPLTVVGNIGTSGSVLFDDNQGVKYGNSNAQITGSSANGLMFFSGGSEAMRFDASGNLGIGTTGASQRLEVHDASSTTTAKDGGVGIAIKNTNSTNNNQASLEFQNSNGTKTASIIATFTDHSTNEGELSFCTGPDGGGTFEEAMRIDKNGRLGIGTTSPSSILHLEDASSPKLIIKDTTNSCQFIAYAQNSNAHLGTSSNHDLFIDTNNTSRIQVHSSGNISFFEDTGSTETLGWSASNERLSLSGSDYQFELKQGSNQPFFLRAVSDGSFRIHLNGTGDIFSVSSAGASSFAGSLTKGSGSFKIDHPLESKKDTHHLVHSFVESPQANNIYRGSVALSDGQATVNLDEVSTMTEGTFVALNTSIHVYTSNESDWDAVKGSVSGNILTIECQNAESNAMVNWLVIGERQDQHMIDTEWTDENGKVIVEPLK